MSWEGCDGMGCERKQGVMGWGVRGRVVRWEGCDGMGCEREGCEVGGV